MSTTCKEQTSTCKCIVKEKVLDNGDRDNSNKGNEKDCGEVYKKLATCLNECLLEKCKEKKNKKSDNDC